MDQVLGPTERPEDYDCLEIAYELEARFGFAACKRCGYWMLSKELQEGACPDCYV